MTYKIDTLNDYSIEELQKIAAELKIEDHQHLDKQSLVYKIIDRNAVDVSLTQASIKKATGTSKRVYNKKNLSPSPRGAQPKTDKDSKTKAPSKEGPTTQETSQGDAKAYIPTEENKPSFSIQDLSLRGIGVLELMPDHYGFLRSPDYNYLPSPDDIYVPHAMIKQLGLKRGDTIEGALRPPRDNEKYFGMLNVDKVNGQKPEAIKGRRDFNYLTYIFPQEKLNIVAQGQHPYGTRFIDMFSPIGKGQRGLIVAQPKTGKTYLLKDIANGIATNHPEVYLMIVLIGERPEEVTDMQRSVKAEVVSSTFMQPPNEQKIVAEKAIEKAKRLAECGIDVVVLMDSITRLARAYNEAERNSGKTGTGGMEATALNKTRKLFGAGNNFENGGSLTFLATALVETGSKLDDIIFEELKGTGNMELQLSRQLANKGIYPAIDIPKSSTRRNELMQSPEVCKRVRVLRQVISEKNPQEALEFIIKNMKNTANNDEFLDSMYRPA